MPWMRSAPAGLLLLLAGLLAGLPLATPIAAQDLRVVIVIPDLVPAAGTPDRFGRQVAEELRKRIESDKHRAFSEREVREALARYGVKPADFNCTLALQLASREGLELAFCGQYRAEPGGGYAFYDVVFAAPGGVARFDVPPFTAGNREEAAAHVVDAFQQYARQLELLSNCNTYVGSMEWDRALTNCDAALALNPDYVPALELKANVLRELGRLEEALALFARVVEAHPLSEANLYNAGYVATQLERRAEARGYFERYLELKPGDAAVRLNIAHELATSGDNLGALELAEAGLQEFAADSAVLTLAEFAGHYAKNAANDVKDGRVEPPVGMGAGALYARALELYTRVYQARGQDTRVELLRNMVLMYRELGRAEEAIGFAEEALATHGEDAGLWWVYATVLGDTGRAAEARRAVARVAELDPDYPSVWARLATFVINAGELEEAVRTVTRAVEAGSPADPFAALMIANAGYSLYADKGQHQAALRWYEAARAFAREARTRHMADFFEGFSVYRMAEAAQEPRTCASARATLGQFQRAHRLMAGSTAYESRNRPEMLAAAQRYVEIQEALLKRCR
ncbi:MAG: tetratricopeptide repeat protein [Gemmatimonadota bacterium]